jgi:hypothetical protein
MMTIVDFAAQQEYAFARLGLDGSCCHPLRGRGEGLHPGKSIMNASCEISDRKRMSLQGKRDSTNNPECWLVGIVGLMLVGRDADGQARPPTTWSHQAQAREAVSFCSSASTMACAFCY